MVCRFWVLRVVCLIVADAGRVDPDSGGLDWWSGVAVGEPFGVVLVRLVENALAGLVDGLSVAGVTVSGSE